MTSIKKYIPETFMPFFKLLKYCLSYSKYIQRSYSQEGEDLILSRLFGDRMDGFYIDVGAHHPKRFSNTYYFYLRGWRGINIDPMPGSMQIFNKLRKRDINLEIPIFNERKKLKYFQFNESALNGFSASLSAERNGKQGFKIINVIEIEGVPLKELLLEHMPVDINTIDFMSIDVEGCDFEVLQSNDWITYRPKVLLVELINSTLNRLEDEPIFHYLKEQHYFVYAKAVQSVFFLSEEYIVERDFLNQVGLTEPNN